MTLLRSAPIEKAPINDCKSSCTPAPELVKVKPGYSAGVTFL